VWPVAAVMRMRPRCAGSQDEMARSGTAHLPCGTRAIEADAYVTGDGNRFVRDLASRGL
jgi:hypothetical protein